MSPNKVFSIVHLELSLAILSINSPASVAECSRTRKKIRPDLDPEPSVVLHTFPESSSEFLIMTHPSFIHIHSPLPE